MCKLNLALIIALATSTAFAQNPRNPETTNTQQNVSGFYRLTVKSEESQKTSEITVYLRQVGDKLEMYDLASKRKYASDIHQSQTVGFKHTFVANFATFELKGREKDKVPFLILAYTDTSGVSAYGFAKNQEFELSVESLASVWACGNHDNPAHTAKSEAEMKEKTAAHGCSLWHKLSAAALM